MDVIFTYECFRTRMTHAHDVEILVMVVADLSAQGCVESYRGEWTWENP